MREDKLGCGADPALVALPRTANSLFRHILRVSYCGSIFCGQRTVSTALNLNKTNILTKRYQKNVAVGYAEA
jgi:hypothetical protein